MGLDAECETGRDRAGQTDQMAMPVPWFAVEGDGAKQREGWLRRMRAGGSLLICDYDGTLAPFQLDKMQAVPYAGVAELLGEIAAGPARVAFVSGRPVAELVELLPMAAQVEVWGMHGREHRLADGTVHRLEPSAAQRAALNAAEAGLRGLGLGEWIERKTASVALHWRSVDAERDGQRLKQVQEAARGVLGPLAGRDALGLLPFDGGLELRAEDHTKGHATEALVRAWREAGAGAGAEAGAEAGGDADAGHGAGAGSASNEVDGEVDGEANGGAGLRGAVAFLGDDKTDEDAFRVMRRVGGLGVLVREPARASLAQVSLAPPGELLRFLEQWRQPRCGDSLPGIGAEGKDEEW